MAYRPGLSADGSPPVRIATFGLGAAVGVERGVADAAAVGVGAAVGLDDGTWTTPTLLALLRSQWMTAQPRPASWRHERSPSVFMAVTSFGRSVLGSPNQGRTAWAWRPARRPGRQLECVGLGRESLRVAPGGLPVAEPRDVNGLCAVEREERGLGVCAVYEAGRADEQVVRRPTRRGEGYVSG